MKVIQAPIGARRTDTLEPKSMPANERLGGFGKAKRTRSMCDLCGSIMAEPLPDLFLCPSCEREEIDRVTGADE